MGRSTMDGTPASSQIVFLEKRLAELEAENQKLQRLLSTEREFFNRWRQTVDNVRAILRAREHTDVT